jgi:sigma-54-specific transcriptional regulator
MSELYPAKLLSFPAHGAAANSAPAMAFISADRRSELLLGQLERLAPSDASVLIAGETGTGKEVAARFLHEHSHRQGSFVAINCAAFNENLVEAELFGHEAGAFTGAQQARAGWFELAHGGTLFLDEIGDMPLYLQAKLLRVLQERQVVRLGARKPIAVDVRVVAATNVELEQAVEARQFRRDLYYRLNVASVRLLPLRERPDDILPLARHFIDRYAKRTGLARATLSEAAAKRLVAHDWPGNIRELENKIHYALVMSVNGIIDVAELRLPFRAETSETAVGSINDSLGGLAEGLRDLLQSERDSVYESVERLLVMTAFEHCDRNQVRTAKRLGLSRNIVRAQLKRYGLLDRGASAGPLRRLETSAGASV